MAPSSRAAPPPPPPTQPAAVHAAGQADATPLGGRQPGMDTHPPTHPPTCAACTSMKKGASWNPSSGIVTPGAAVPPVLPGTSSPAGSHAGKLLGASLWVPSCE